MSRALVVIKGILQAILRQLGFQLVRNTRPKSVIGFSHGLDWTLPSEYAERLQADNPELIKLRERYQKSTLPMAVHTWWDDDYISANLDLRYFRGDNVYVWQTRHMGDSAVQRYYLFLREVEARDTLGLFSKLTEDGAFGSWVYHYHRRASISRDLLDSINEINFLERHAGVSQIAQLGILDIGAGYGRMAHRCCEALPNLADYFCVDAVAESTFIAETYLDYRGCQAKASVVPLDELSLLEGKALDLAINVHSFSEMSLRAIEGWLEFVSRLSIPRLFIVPNDAEAFLTMEADGTRKDFLPAIHSRGYHQVAKEPVISDDDVRDLISVQDHMFLFERKRP